MAGLLLVTAVPVATLAGCSGPGTTSEVQTTPDPDERGVLSHDGWAKAADSGMTAAFGVFTNETDRDIRLVSASTPAAARVELHETTMAADGGMSMRQVEDGLVIPAHGELRLEPGGYHLMLIDLTGPIRPGDQVDITLTSDDELLYSLGVAGRSFAGAEEEYVEHGSHDG